MSNFGKMQDRVTNRYHNKIKKFCMPLIDSFGISQFYYYRITTSGHFMGANMNDRYAEYFYENLFNDYPFFRHPDNIQSGLCFLQGVEDKRHDRLLSIASEKYNVNFSLQFTNKIHKGFEAFGFGINSNTPAHHMVLAHEVPLLHLFVKHFQAEFKTMFLDLENYQVDLNNLIGSGFFKLNNPLNGGAPKSLTRQEFLEQMGLEFGNLLTERERSVVRNLLLGYSSSQIAEKLFLSGRTVEHHLERLKDKLNCFSKAELIQKTRELESLGCL